MSDPKKQQAGLLRLTIEHTPSPNDPKGADEFRVAFWKRIYEASVVPASTAC